MGAGGVGTLDCCSSSNITHTQVHRTRDEMTECRAALSPTGMDGAVVASSPAAVAAVGFVLPPLQHESESVEVGPTPEEEGGTNGMRSIGSAPSSSAAPPQPAVGPHTGAFSRWQPCP